MRNKILVGLLFIIFIFSTNLFAKNKQENLEFQVSKIEIKDEGNIVIGKDRGIISSNEKIFIEADTFKYNKILNILELSGKIIIRDEIKNIKIFSENIKYNKNLEEINSYGTTKVIIDEKYMLISENLIFDRVKMFLTSSKKASIKDINNNYYEFKDFNYLINEQILKANNIYLETRDIDSKNNIDTNKFYFENGIFDLKNQKFSTKNLILKFNKNLLGRNENDPRIYAVSAVKENNITYLNKAIFTSCKINDDCPPWTLQADQIIHDNIQKKIIYKNALLKIYDVPVFYFPKFFHPDPSVKRQSGFLQPRLNKSNILSSSLQVPYYLAYSQNQDWTFKPTLFDDGNMFMLQNEYRYKGLNSSFITDFSMTRGYKSSTTSKKKNINHIFLKYNLDLGLPNFISSNLSSKFEKITNDTYLKVFKTNLSTTEIFPNDLDTLSSEITLDLKNTNFNLVTGMNVFEKLQMSKNDRYQYILPFYDLTKSYYDKSNYIYFDFNSSGENKLENTNNLKTEIINNFDFKSFDIITKKGFVNNFGLYIKNINSRNKNNNNYNSNYQFQLMPLIEFNSSLPMISLDNEFKNNFDPKLSIRYSPVKINNYSESEKKIDIANLFEIERLGLNEAHEPGASLTVGLDYKKESLKNINRYFQTKIGTIIRNNEENDIPKKTTLNKKYSNYFGSIEGSWDDLLNIKYDFSLDNNLKSLEYNSLELNLIKNDFFANLVLYKEDGIIGDENTIENTVGYKIDEYNLLKFSTRRNKKINLTEFYDLVYEYKNDCLTAGIKYKKTFYRDRDLKPSEDLMFTITLFPITTLEQNAGKSF